MSFFLGDPAQQLPHRGTDPPIEHLRAEGAVPAETDLTRSLFGRLSEVKVYKDSGLKVPKQMDPLRAILRRRWIPRGARRRESRMRATLSLADAPSEALSVSGGGTEKRFRGREALAEAVAEATA